MGIVTAATEFTLADLAEEWGPSQHPLTERQPQTERQKRWAEDGFLILPNFADEALMAAYEDEWLAHNADSPGGWDYATPYMEHPALRALCCDMRLAIVLSELLGEPAGVHLNLTGWRSTRRDWHFDQYLNEPYVGGFYVAMWLALDDIHPDSGPFEYVPRSHHWYPPISQAKMRYALGPDGAGPDWPTKSERILTPLFESELALRDITPHRFLAMRGDVLLWHGRLLHRGSPPVDPEMERRGLIAHFSGIHHRPDMPAATQHERGGWFFPLGGRQPVSLP
jgi:hypothetical protein